MFVVVNYRHRRSKSETSNSAALLAAEHQSMTLAEDNNKDFYTSLSEVRDFGLYACGLQNA